MVIDEGDGAGGPPPDDPRRFALRIPQPPELPQVQRFLQHPLCPVHVGWCMAQLAPMREEAFEAQYVAGDA